ncbi:MAG: hypothetical protein RLZ48_758 [Actinomycetota bacterium]|jgi:hypothetical protein
MAWTTLGTVAPGDVLRANSGTAAYNNVIGNLGELRDTPSFLTASSTNTETGGANADFTYSAAEITLTPGTWLVQAGASLTNTATSDSASVSLWNQTAGSEVSNSTGVQSTTTTTFISGILSRVVSVTVTSNTAYRVRCKRNGASTIRAQSAAGSAAAYLWAQRVKTA